MYPGSKVQYPFTMEADNGKRPPTSQPGVPESTLKRHKPADPSKVVHVRNLPDQTNELELSELVRSFGLVNKTLLLSAKRQAFIELNSIEAATNLVNAFSINPPLLRGKQVMFQFSTRSEISLNENHQRFDTVPPSKILLVSIADMRALVQIEHLEQVFSAHGVLNKIVIFEKNGFHAFVEMKSVEEATRALSRLHGQSLFVGCCTLSVQYSTLEKLSMPQVPDQRKARDYQAMRDPSQAQRMAMQQPQIQHHGAVQGGYGGNTNPVMGAPQHHHQQQGIGGNNNGVTSQAQASAARFFQQQGVMGGMQPQMQHHMQPMGGAGGQMSGGGPGMFGGNQQTFNPMGFQAHGAFGGRPGQGGVMGVAGLGGMGGQMGQRGPMVLDNRISLEPGGVILVNNLDEAKVTPDALFNLFGVFGDVYRVKILFKKKSSALVQMANANQAALALNFLNRHTLWGQELYLTHSKFQEVQLPRQGSGIDPESDEANLTKDYSSSRGHRFRRVDSKNFKNVCAPSSILHLANLHEGAIEQELYDLFKEFGVRRVQFFNVNRAMALVEAPDSDVASQILIKYHNHQLGDRNVKISFSRKSSIPDFSNSNRSKSSAQAPALSAAPAPVVDATSTQPGGDAAAAASAAPATAGVAGTAPPPQQASAATTPNGGEGAPVVVPSE